MQSEDERILCKINKQVLLLLAERGMKDNIRQIACVYFSNDDDPPLIQRLIKISSIREIE